MARLSREMRATESTSRPRCAGRALPTPGQEANAFRRGGKITDKDIALFHPPVGDDDEVRRPFAADFRYRRARP